MRLLQTVSIVLVAGIVGAGCGGRGPQFIASGGGANAHGAKQPCVIVIEIQNNALTRPAPASCSQDGKVVFVFVNDDSVDHDITIDPKTIYDKNDPNHQLKNPFDKDDPIVGKPGGNDVDWAKWHLKGNADKTTYKYTITCPSCTNSPLDPDIEIAM